MGVNEKTTKFKKGSRSHSWSLVKQKLAVAKVDEVLRSPKIFINGNKFTILQVLGEGGYSTVYEVYDKEKNLLAVKVVDLLMQRDKMKDCLIREIFFLEKLKKCSFVVKAFDYEIIESKTEHKVIVLMEKGDRDMFSIMESHQANNDISPSKLR